jgi:hypothetical protein
VSDGWGIIGDSMYEATMINWWDYACMDRNLTLPKTLSDILTALKPYGKILSWFEKYKLNIIVCECACAQNAMPMVRFYRWNNTDNNIIAEYQAACVEDPEPDDDPFPYITDPKKISSSYHIIYVDRKESNLLESPVRVYSKYSADRFGVPGPWTEIDEKKKYTRPISY